MSIKNKLKPEVFNNMVNLPSTDDGADAFWISNTDQFDIMSLDNQARQEQLKLNQIIIDEKPLTIREAIKSAIKEIKINALVKQSDIVVQKNEIK